MLDIPYCHNVLLSFVRRMYWAEGLCVSISKSERLASSFEVSLFCQGSRYRVAMQLVTPKLVAMAVRMAIAVWMMNFHVSFLIVVQVFNFLLVCLMLLASLCS